MTRRTINELAYRATRLNIPMQAALSFEQYAQGLTRWAERECGNSNDFASWYIEVDDDGKAWSIYQPYHGKESRSRIRNMEASYLRRIAELCAKFGLHFYHQTDPRGLSLYVHTEPLDASNYTNGSGFGF